MKKMVKIIITLGIAGAMLVGCGEKPVETTVESEVIAEVPEVEAESEAEESEIEEVAEEPEVVEPEEEEIEVTDADLERENFELYPYHAPSRSFALDEVLTRVNTNESMSKEIMTEMIKRGYDMDGVIITNMQQVVLNNSDYSYVDIGSALINYSDLDESKIAMAYHSFSYFTENKYSDITYEEGFEERVYSFCKEIGKSYYNMISDKDYQMIDFHYNPDLTFTQEDLDTDESPYGIKEQITPNDFMNAVVYAIFEDQTVDLYGSVSPIFWAFSVE